MTEYHDIEGKPTTLRKLCRTETEWAESRIERLQARNELLEKMIRAADLLADEVRCEERKGLLVSDAAMHYFTERQALVLKEQNESHQ